MFYFVSMINTVKGKFKTEEHITMFPNTMRKVLNLLIRSC